ncbi:MAG: beta-galactosidase [Armatimonadota bacterium]
MNPLVVKFLVFALVLTALYELAEAGQSEVIGPTKIPFYTGNLSVSPFMMYWGTSKGPASDLASRERINLLKRISCFADCDYQAWSLAQQQKDKWDFDLYIRNADALHAAGLKYAVFCWVHFPPKWFLNSAEFVPYRCAEHGENLMQLSCWAPNIWDIYRRFYAAQHKAMGDRIDWIRVATPSDYGEIGYPAAMTSWLVPQNHAYSGYWCGDPYARADFRAEMQKRFKDVKALNKRWGTWFESWEDVSYPELVDEKAARTARESGKSTDRRRWLDFVEWYNGVWLRFTPKLAALIREFYPGKPLVASVGYASELTRYGNDYSAIPKMAKEHNLALQTPGNVPYYALKRLSTACHFYGCHYYTEPPGDVPPDTEVARVFADVSNGVRVYFEYPQNLERAIPQLRKYKDHMTGARPLVDLAIFNPTVDHRLHAGEGNFPINSFMLGERGRDLFDYDVVDEFLIRDGALDRYRVLVYVQGNVTEEFALRKIAGWVRRGGALVTCDLGDVETVEGDTSIWYSLVPRRGSGPELSENSGMQPEAGTSARPDIRRVGSGLVIRSPLKPDQHDGFAELVTRAAYHLSEFDKHLTDAPLIDGVRDGVLATLLPDRILYFNGTDKEIRKHVKLRPEDWTSRSARPERMEYDLVLAPHSIEAIMLK